METIKGRIVEDTEMRYTQNATAVTNIRVELDKEPFDRIKIVAWEDLAEACHQDLQEGDDIYAKGYWKERTWQTPQGETKLFRDFTAKQVWLVKEDGVITEIVQEEVPF